MKYGKSYSNHCYYIYVLRYALQKSYLVDRLSWQLLFFRKKVIHDGHQNIFYRNNYCLGDHTNKRVFFKDKV